MAALAVDQDQRVATAQAAHADRTHDIVVREAVDRAVIDRRQQHRKRFLERHLAGFAQLLAVDDVDGGGAVGNGARTATHAGDDDGGPTFGGLCGRVDGDRIGM